MALQDCDLIIRNGVVLTMNAARVVHASGAIAVCGHTIAAVGSEADVLRGWRSARIVDARGAMVHPGYIEAHLHVNAQTSRGFFRGDTSVDYSGDFPILTVRLPTGMSQIDPAAMLVTGSTFRNSYMKSEIDQYQASSRKYPVSRSR